MSTLTLDSATERSLSSIAALTGESPAEIVKRAVAAYLEELEEDREALAVRERVAAGTEGTSPLADVVRRLGLDG